MKRCCGVPSPSHRCQRRVVHHGPRRCHRVTPPGGGGRAAYLIASPALVLHGGDQQAGAAAGLGPCPARRLAQAHHGSHALAAAPEPQDWQVPAEDFYLTRQPHHPASCLPAARPLKLGATRRAGPPGVLHARAARGPPAPAGFGTSRSSTPNSPWDGYNARV